MGVRRKEGGLCVDAPVLSRFYQLLGEGHISFMQCKKIRDTPFPFPYAQLMRCLLWLLVVTIPFVLSNYLQDQWPATGYSFCISVAFFSLNEVARELEVRESKSHDGCT